MSQSIFDLQAELCQAMSNATRLRIVHELREGPRRVNELAAATHLAQSKVSQHLAILRARNLVTAHRAGNESVYQITNPKIERVCDLMREVLAEQAAQRSELISTIRQDG
ncbi:MAG: winged helix-turn-helix transcriptional regulator [Chloroflexi bacterium]|nr:winged helix-turn-helix transcriptional regulator [Chloroflexota bacterium]